MEPKACQTSMFQSPRDAHLMTLVRVDPAKVHTFESAESFYKWLSENHGSEDELWIKIYKMGSGLKSITPKEAIDVALCWGWIDAIRKGLDNKSYLQRYTRRGRKSTWSQINVNNVARLDKRGPDDRARVEGG